MTKKKRKESHQYLWLHVYSGFFFNYHPLANGKERLNNYMCWNKRKKEFNEIRDEGQC